ncbi:hypothetical protein [Streptomyces luteolus]|uniref:Integral membrane protein n=1 Tax=Streptomyces luteolus TaxID=3043615 RepID=A0ABT6SQX8_9ACTN|nr:hypothetical protein [Streptomyces sp. B-S-A12]MDI3417990.1 hypothetical protein [Streptomyces sp. B-S-A12]
MTSEENSPKTEGADRFGTGEAEWPTGGPGDTVVRVMLVLFTLGFGFAVKLFGPLLAIACDSCQDGVRTLRFGGAIEILSDYVVPVVTLVTAVAFLAPDDGVKAGVIGLAILGALFFVMVALGHAA